MSDSYSSNPNQTVVEDATSSSAETETEWRRKQIEKNQAAILLLESWLAEEETPEKRETWEYLKKALDKDRLSDRKLIPL